MDAMMKEELKFDDYNATIKLKRIGNVLVEFQGKSAMVTLPLQVDIVKKPLSKILKPRAILK